MIPTIHSNGTSLEGLREDLFKAHTKIVDALNALCQAAPHGRDYYTQGPDAYNAARREHESRLARLRSVRDELMQVWEGAQAQKRG